MVACPGCGETEELSGAPENGVIMITCERCGTRWDRDLTPTCRLCGSTDLQPVHTATLEEAGRGDQRTPSGIRIAYYCWSCGGADVTSAHPRPGPNPPPGVKGDLRGLRDRID